MSFLHDAGMALIFSLGRRPNARSAGSELCGDRARPSSHKHLERSTILTPVFLDAADYERGRATY